MKIIEDIRPCPDDPSMRQVIVDNAVFATLREAEIEAMELTVQMEWTESLALDISTRLEHDTARRHLLKELGRRGLTSGQAETFLDRRGYPACTSKAVIGRLIEDGWLDDVAAGESILAGILRKGPAGIAFLQRRLSDRGIPEPVAASLAAAATKDLPESDAARLFAESLLPRYASLQPQIAARRLGAALARRGFSLEIASEVVATLLDAPPTDTIPAFLDDDS